ncbi:MAG: tetratricopeptide repeat protein [Bacteroidota bacterium]
MSYFKPILTFIILFTLTLPELFAQEQQANESFAAAERHRKARRYSEAIAGYETAISYAPTITKFYVQKGKCHFILKQHDAAIETMETALEVDPQAFEAYNALWKLYNEKGDSEKMLQTYDRAIEAANSSKVKLVYTIKILEYLEGEKMVDEMVPYLEQAREYDFNAPETQYMWGRYEIDKGNYEAAIPYLKKAEASMVAKNASPEQLLPYFFWLGKAYYETGGYDNAIPILREVKGGKYKQQAFRMLPDYNYYVAAAYSDLFQDDEAEKVLMNVLAMDDSFAPASKLLTRVKSIQKGAAELATNQKAAVRKETDPKKQFAKAVQLADFQLRAEQYADAKETTLQLSTQKPNVPDVVLINLLAGYYASPNLGAVAAIEEKAKSLTGNDQSRYEAMVALLYKAEGNQEKAIEYFKKVHRNPKSDFRHLADYELVLLHAEDEE